VTFKVVLVSLYILTSLKAWLTVPVTEVCVALDEVALVISDVVSAETLGVGVDVSVCVSEADLVVEDCAFTGVFDTDWASLVVGSCEVGSLPDWSEPTHPAMSAVKLAVPVRMKLRRVFFMLTVV